MKALSLLLLFLSSAFGMTMNKKTVAVTGSTGRLGRRAVVELAKQSVPTRCLVRREPKDSTKPDLDGTSEEVAAYLQSLPNVELVKGDVTKPESIENLMEGCTSILALHGVAAGSVPPWRSLLLPAFGGVLETDPRHSKMINYVGVQNIIAAAKRRGSACRRIVRITGKGETPMSFFSILINMFGTMAKAWNYEGEELLRQSGLDYTIIRPGIMMAEVPAESLRGLKDDGGDLPVSQVSYGQIAELSIQCLDYDNAAKATLTAMNVEQAGESTYDKLLEAVQPDRREFPKTLLEEHKNGARLGATILVLFAAIFAKVLAGGFGKLMSLF